MGFFNGQIKNPAITPQANNNGGFFRSYGMPVIGPKFVPGTEKKTLGKKVMGFGQDLAKDALGTLLVKPAARATEAITRVAFPNSLAAKGYEAMADEGQTQSFNIPGLQKVLGGPIDVEQQKAFGQGGGTQILGQALHSAAYLAPYGKIGSFFGARAFPMGAKVTAANIAKYKLLGEAAAGGLGGGAFGGGAAMEQGLPAEEVLKQTAIGTGLGVVAPVVIAGASKLLKGKAKIPTSVEEAVTKEAIPVVKTAVKDEISNIKGETVYHGGSKINNIDLNKSNYAKTFFVTDKPEYAKSYGGKKSVLNKFELNPKAKLIDIKNASPEQIQQIRNEIERIKSEHVPYSGKGGFNPTFGGTSEELLDGAIRGKSHFAEDPALVEVYKNLGYDGMVSYEQGLGGAKNIGIWNKEVLKNTSINNKIKPTPKINITDKDVSAFDDFFKNTGDTAEDRVYKKSTVSNWINKAEEVKQTKSIDELIDIVQKKTGTTEIEGLPNEALRKVLQRDKTLTDAQKYRLKNTLSGSESGADLRAMQIDNNGIINNEFDYAKSVEAKMREKLNEAKVTNKTISRFLDDIECK
jgi:hypothetical protein